MDAKEIGELGSKTEAIKKPVVLAILDGFGLNNRMEGNAASYARTPVIDSLLADYPSLVLEASGEEVGLPTGQMGNSEVGHTNIGAGRVVYQDLLKITNRVGDGSFFENKVLLDAVANAKKNSSGLHFMGLVSDGGVHSHTDHLYALLELAKREGVEDVYIHAFLDGRDTPPDSGKGYIEDLEGRIKELGVNAKIATVGGRYYGMDRDKRWDRIEGHYNAMVSGEGETANSALEAIEKAYKRGETDEFVKPTVILEGDKPVGMINDKDSVVFFNFRSDRATEITHALTDKDFMPFKRKKTPDTFFAGMTEYEASLNVSTAFPDEGPIMNTLGSVLSEQGLRVVRIAETEKFAHVTFFLNGGREAQFPGEHRWLIPSPNVPTYDYRPEMSAEEVTKTMLDLMESGEFDVFIINFANSDMVGHTGKFREAVRAVETVDRCLGRVIDEVKGMGGAVLVTADHGNSDEMIDRRGKSHTKHTTHKVPLVLVSDQGVRTGEGGKLSDIAPTMLELMDIPIPPQMTGDTLFERKRIAH